MLFAFTDDLIVTNKFDAESAMLADRHYSRQTPGDRQFLPPGKTIPIRNAEGSIIFGWNWQLPEKRADHEIGYCCSIFRNETNRQSSDIILECEAIAEQRWGVNRKFTYVNPSKILSRNPGYCFKMAGWKFMRISKGGLHLLAKEANA